MCVYVSEERHKMTATGYGEVRARVRVRLSGILSGFPFSIVL